MEFKAHMIKWMNYRLVYLMISGTMLFAGVFSLIKWGLKPSVDFTGGSVLELKFDKQISTEQASNIVKEDGIDVTSVSSIGTNSYIFRLPAISDQQKQEILTTLGQSLGNVSEQRFELVGPSIGPELIKKTYYAIFVSAGAILLWVAYQFKSIKFGASAILAMFHDSLVLLGSFSLLGHFLGVEIDFLFVTAMLTILSFSVHDTIVVYDRIRESQKKFGGTLHELADKAITETMVRSLNNSFTIMFMLVALVLLGGTTVKWFAVALLIGTISGTYSSPFVAVPLLVTWDEAMPKLKSLFSKISKKV
jgi:preprotein translocase subunit SecF